MSPDLTDKTSIEAQLTLDRSERAGIVTGLEAPWSEPASGSHRETGGRRALGLTLRAAFDELPEQVERIKENASIAQAKIEDLINTPLPGSSEDAPSPGNAWPLAFTHERDTILQPPRPDVVPSARILVPDHFAQLEVSHAEPEPS